MWISYSHVISLPAFGEFSTRLGALAKVRSPVGWVLSVKPS